MYFWVKLLFILSNYEAAIFGGMVLPIINGPSDGSFLIAIVFTLPFIFGENIYLTVIYGYYFKTIIITFMLIGNFITIFIW